MVNSGDPSPDILRVQSAVIKAVICCDNDPWCQYHSGAGHNELNESIGAISLYAKSSNPGCLGFSFTIDSKLKGARVKVLYATLMIDHWMC